jgi:hypothetical protein
VVVRISPIHLPVSSEIRLKRVQPRAILKQDVGQLIVPMPVGDDVAQRVVVLLGELLPAAAAGPVTGPPAGGAPTITAS